jgi:hypothetical protein
MVTNQKGISIIEVIAMSGVMITMMMAFISMMNNESENINYLEDKLSRVALETELRTLFLSDNFCKNLLKDLVAPRAGQTSDITQSFTAPESKAALEKVFKESNGKLLYDHLDLKRISLEDSDLTAPNSAGAMSMVFYPERQRKGGGPAALQPIKIKTSVNVDGGYSIESCEMINQSNALKYVGTCSTSTITSKGPNDPVTGINGKTAQCRCNQGETVMILTGVFDSGIVGAADGRRGADGRYYCRVKNQGSALVEGEVGVDAFAGTGDSSDPELQGQCTFLCFK